SFTIKKNRMQTTNISIENTVNAPVEKVWQYWTTPEHICKWNNASADWHTPRAENDLRVGGKFSSRMEARDGSFGFDFGGVYDEVKTNEVIAYTLADGRKVKIIFTSQGNTTKVAETFDAENENPVEMQRGGWQAILDNFKKYTEAN
ncbi:MAG: SRPBCC family protein, partial [Ferruginibacter sp.]